eukprot:CAMPEP_0180137856 /NCGR_PEP_ID=MMETSP0986-20121125/12499_1 /TAXON_ID=697907 /ORGANISM="non described non described, Strain CCMP2293" /LENGTH=93 /DNA_ID=CAMNT_0022079473 /DNA_START=76 /DNA_END=357 /DNA_ORIENTATION=+
MSLQIRVLASALRQPLASRCGARAMSSSDGKNHHTVAEREEEALSTAKQEDRNQEKLPRDTTKAQAETLANARAMAHAAQASEAKTPQDIIGK